MPRSLKARVFIGEGVKLGLKGVFNRARGSMYADGKVLRINRDRAEAMLFQFVLYRLHLRLRWRVLREFSIGKPLVIGRRSRVIQIRHSLIECRLIMQLQK